MIWLLGILDHFLLLLAHHPVNQPLLPGRFRLNVALNTIEHLVEHTRHTDEHIRLQRLHVVLHVANIARVVTNTAPVGGSVVLNETLVNVRQRQIAEHGVSVEDAQAVAAGEDTVRQSGERPVCVNGAFRNATRAGRVNNGGHMGTLALRKGHYGLPVFVDKVIHQECLKAEGLGEAFFVGVQFFEQDHPLQTRYLIP
ncbi:peptidase M15, putative [Babesia ovata]|uniref:Peptidase M15, putative n=1 Tax=Babesia ovata TaxID=189622 RepID=A0A2H6KDA2_9APIC|nr:peptidase M15, putative [Babesia ovata]GBE60978.1 peptidase M15, putative [Babesia ovata]